ncbi:MAG: hypothetical protein R3A47_08690 [Polyangiales bacterium]
MIRSNFSALLRMAYPRSPDQRHYLTVLGTSAETAGEMLRFAMIATVVFALGCGGAASEPLEPSTTGGTSGAGGTAGASGSSGTGGTAGIAGSGGVAGGGGVAGSAGAAGAPLDTRRCFAMTASITTTTVTSIALTLIATRWAVEPDVCAQTVRAAK